MQSVHAHNTHMMQITQQKLNETNFLKWTHSMMLVIRGKGQIRYLKGAVKELKGGE